MTGKIIYYNKEYAIVKDREHYELWIDGNFYCSGDTLKEIEDELEKVENGG